MKKYNLIIAFENLLYMLHEPWIGNFYYRQCGAIEGSILRSILQLKGYCAFEFA